MIEFNPGDTAVFNYSLPFDYDSDICARLYHRSNQVVTVLGLGASDGDPDETPAERVEAGTPLVYIVKFPDGYEDCAFEDELTTTL